MMRGGIYERSSVAATDRSVELPQRFLNDFVQGRAFGVHSAVKRLSFSHGVLFAPCPYSARFLSVSWRALRAVSIFSATVSPVSVAFLSQLRVWANSVPRAMGHGCSFVQCCCASNVHAGGSGGVQDA